jgi:hypothetical protein
MLSKRGLGIYVILIASFIILLSMSVEGAEYSLTVSGLHPIFISGRSDLEPISDPNVGEDPSFPLERYPANASITYAAEMLPEELPVRGGDEISFEATGLIMYMAAWKSLIEADPDGREIEKSDYLGVGGISGYKGPHGALLGVFLDGNVPSEGPAPMTADFTESGESTQFETLYPELGQVFFIGDGYNDAGSVQTFVAPFGATRVLLGVADGRFYSGQPGYYGNNTGLFEVVAYLPDSAITATVDCRPHKLILRNRGRYIKAYLELEEGYDAQEIDRFSVMITEINGIVLNDPISAKRFTRVGDRDRDGIRDLKVKFSRKQLVPLLSEGKNEITIVGVLNDGTDFEGVGEITAKKRHHNKKCRKSWK